jgi:ProP effector
MSNETIGALAAKFPKAFFVYERRRRPLKLGIHLDIAAAAPEIPAKEIRTALRIYVTNTGYLHACKAGATRIDLNGEPAGCVTDDEARNAAERRTARSKPAAPKRLGLADLKRAWQARALNSGASP